MIIKKLRLNNFRQFKGDTTVEFSCDNKKNVTVILGNNTFGKTTLLQAFNWCFYGKAALPNNQMLLNYDVCDIMESGQTALVEVEITLLHGGKEQIISRRQQYRKHNDIVSGEDPILKVSTKTVDGEIEILPNKYVHQKSINQILPENLSGYFFFDTERVGTISESRDLTDAVKGLLGLKTLSETKKHLGNRLAKTSVVGGFYASMDVNGDQRAELALQIINAARENIETLRGQVENYEQEMSIYNARKEKLAQVLRQSRETAELQKERERLQKWIEQDSKSLVNMKQNLIDAFGQSSGALKFFLRPLISQALGYLKEAKVDDKGIVGLKAPTLYALLERGMCVCGQKLEKGNEAYNHIMEELKFVPPEHLGTTIKNYKDTLVQFNEGSENAFGYMSELDKSIKVTTLRINQWRERVEEIENKISGQENMQAYEIELQNVKRRINEFSSKRNSCLLRIGAEEQKIEQNQKVYDKLIAATGKNAKLRKYIEYAEALQKWFDELYKEQENGIKNKLQTKVNEIFNNMYSGERTVTINDKYQVTLLAKVGDKFQATGESEGLNRVKNFAFIAGLVSLAKERVYKKLGSKQIALYDEPYPLVMDAPFSNADEFHTASISKELPGIAEQIIMFVMRKDWAYAEPVISQRVGKKYELDKRSEQYTVLKEV